MHPTRLLLSLSALGLLACSAPAQTAIWVGQGNLATFGDWNDPADWDTGQVPDSPAATVVINQVTPAYRNWPDGPYVNASNIPVASVTGGALPIITGSITLGQLRFDLPAASSPYQAAVYVGNPGTGATGSLRLEGAGVDFRTSGGSSLTADLNVTPGSSLILANRAQFTRTNYYGLNLYLSDSTATPVNPARLVLQDDAAFTVQDPFRLTVTSRGAASIVFMDRARAGNTVFQLGKQTTIEFHNTASAESADIRLGADNLLLFDGDSTAGASTIQFASSNYSPNSIIVRFAGRSSAAQSSINASTSYASLGAVEFTEQATGGTGRITARRLDISGAATAAGTTGRQRAATSILAPASVEATDARTIGVGAISVQDVLLGSNTLQVESGFIMNLRDSGGAYLSAAGENLIGGRLLKTGPGTLYLYGPSYNPADPSHPSYNVITATTIVRQGTLILYNRLANVTVESAGILRGPGIVDGRLVNQGRVGPETSILRVSGDYVQTSAGTFAPYFAYTPGMPTTYGLAIAGNANLAGTLAANTHPNMFTGWAPGVVQIQVLSAAAITGRFDTFDSSGNSARIKVDVLYAPTTVGLRFEMLPFAALGATPGATALGAYLDRVYRHTGDYFVGNHEWVGDNLTYATNREKVAQTMADLGPDRYGAVLEHGFATARARRTALDRAAGGNQALAGTRRTAVFAEGGRRDFTYAAVDGLPRAESSTTGWQAGGRWQQGAWTLGGYVAAEKTDLLLDAAGSSARVDSSEPGVFARFDSGDYFVHAGAGFSRDRYRLLRRVQFNANSTLDVHHAAAPDGRRTDWSFTAGRTWRGRHGSISPFAGIVVSRWELDDFTESTDLPYAREALTVGGWARSSRSARVGFEAEGTLLQGRLRPHLTAAWWREFADDRSIPARFVGESTGYLAPGRPAETDLVQASLGVDWLLGRRLVLSVNAGLAEGRYSRTTADFSAGLHWSF